MIKLKNFILVLFIINLAFGLYAVPEAPSPIINAESAILIDAVTGTVLFEKNADLPIPPASMTKLMTIHTAMKFVAERQAKLSDYVPISKNADFRSLPPRSSLMFIEEGQQVTLKELLRGLALPSGNDAGIAVAEYLAGSVEAFVERMNSEARQLGMSMTHFADSSGLSEYNRTTAREYASFCSHYIREHAGLLKDLHSLTEFTYPEKHNLPESGNSVHGPITQPNHNLLIDRMAGVDGLKTGYIDESGYNIAVTAESDGRRLILVTMGGPGRNSSDGSLRRLIDAVSLLNYGFYAWTEFIPQVPAGKSVPIRAGAKDSLRISYSGASELLIKTSLIDELVFVPKFNEITLPLTAGSIIGRWELKLGEQILQSGIIYAAEDMNKGNIFRRLKALFVE